MPPRPGEYSPRPGQGSVERSEQVRLPSSDKIPTHRPLTLRFTLPAHLRTHRWHLTRSGNSREAHEAEQRRIRVTAPTNQH